jgi:hypothetical protein
MSKEQALAMMTGEAVAPVAPVTESKPSEAIVGTPLDSDRFAKLAAKEAALQKEREAFKSEQQKIYEEREKLKSIQAQIQDFEKKRSENPIEALKILGFSDTDIFNALAGQEKPAPTPEEIARQAAQEELKKYEEAQTLAQTKLQEERDAKAITAYKDQIGKYIEKEAEKFEYLNHYGAIAYDAVYETVLQFMAADPQLSPVQAMREAAESLENYYEEEDLALMSLKKRQAKVAPRVEAVPETTPPVRRGAMPPKQVPTLNSRTTATTASASIVKESREQKRARLESMLRQGAAKT